MQQNKSLDVILVSLAPPTPIQYAFSQAACPARAIQMDVFVPFAGGMEATELIRTCEQTRRLEPTPIIALTALASTYVRNRICAH